MLISKRHVVPVFAVALAAVLSTGADPPTAAAAAARDGDRLPDRWERRHGLSTRHRSGRGDPDRDGLRNRGELRHRTHPRKADTDGDGVKDGHEVRLGTNPRKPNGSRKAGRFPNPASTGVPAGWAPKQTRTSDLHVRTAGAVVKDVLLQGADLVVDAPDVTVRRVKLQGGSIENFRGRTCQNGLTVEDTSIEPPPGQNTSTESEGAISTGGYTARRLEIWRRAEGFRVGGTPDCGPVRIEDSFAKIVIPDGRCDLHSDGVQGYDGGPVAIANVTVDFTEAACGTAPFFVPAEQGNTSATIDRMLVLGGGYPFRMGVPGTVSGLRIVDRSWGYGPINVGCSRISAWEAAIVKITPDYQVSRTVRRQPCNTQGAG